MYQREMLTNRAQKLFGQINCAIFFTITALEIICISEQVIFLPAKHAKHTKGRDSSFAYFAGNSSLRPLRLGFSAVGLWCPGKIQGIIGIVKELLAQSFELSE